MAMMAHLATTNGYPQCGTFNKKVAWEPGIFELRDFLRQPRRCPHYEKVAARIQCALSRWKELQGD
jgi:hypothetical protein